AREAFARTGERSGHASYFTALTGESHVIAVYGIAGLSYLDDVPGAAKSSGGIPFLDPRGDGGLFLCPDDKGKRCGRYSLAALVSKLQRDELEAFALVTSSAQVLHRQGLPAAIANIGAPSRPRDGCGGNTPEDAGAPPTHAEPTPASTIPKRVGEAPEHAAAEAPPTGNTNQPGAADSSTS